MYGSGSGAAIMSYDDDDIDGPDEIGVIAMVAAGVIVVILLVARAIGLI